MNVIFLDQNQWVKLGRSLKSPEEYPELCALAQKMQRSVDDGKLIIPLTSANIYETSKINKLERRERHAYLLCALSKGRVFQGRQRRLETEVSSVLGEIYNINVPSEPSQWFLSDVFIDAFVEYNDTRIGTKPNKRVCLAPL